MDNRSFINRLAKSLDSDAKETARLTVALNSIIGESIAENCDVALPGFGSFESVKKEDYIETDPETGQRTLVPPCIKIEFKPGSRLKKAIAKL